MRYDYIDLCKRLADWYGGKLEFIEHDSLLYESDTEYSKSVRAIIWKRVELCPKTNNQVVTNNQVMTNNSHLNLDYYAIYGYSALVGAVAKGNKAACKNLLEFLLAKTWHETYYGTWPASIYDKSRQFKQNWLKFDDLRMLDVELTLRGF